LARFGQDGRLAWAIAEKITALSCVADFGNKAPDLADSCQAIGDDQLAIHIDQAPDMFCARFRDTGVIAFKRKAIAFRRAWAFDGFEAINPIEPTVGWRIHLWGLHRNSL
jgi:hypothetical protein